MRSRRRLPHVSALSRTIACAFGVVAAAYGSARAQIITESTPDATAPLPVPTVHPHRKRVPKTVPAAAPAPNAFAPPRLLWRTLLHSVVGAPLVTREGVWIAAGNSLILLDAGGHTVALYAVGATGATPMVDSDHIYVGTDRGTVYAYDRRDPKLAWKATQPADAVSQTPVVGAGRVYVASSDNCVYALSATDGTLQWTFPRPDGSLSYGGPTLATDGLCVCGDSTVYKIDAATGKQIWHTPIGGKSLSTPISSGTRLFVGGDGVGLTALASDDGHQLWTFTGTRGSEWFGCPLVTNGVVYAGTDEHGFYALDAETGKLRWSVRLPGPCRAQAALDARRHVLYAASTTRGDAPTLTALDARSGHIVWEDGLGSIVGAPLIVGDRLYVGDAQGYFYAFSLR